MGVSEVLQSDLAHPVLFQSNINRGLGGSGRTLPTQPNFKTQRTLPCWFSLENLTNKF